MVTKQDHLNLIKRYVLAYNNDVNSSFDFKKNKTRTELSYELRKQIEEIFDLQEKLIARVNSQWRDAKALQENPEAVFEWDVQPTLDFCQEIYDLLGIDPPNLEA
jgi:hypothetical protein